LPDAARVANPFGSASKTGSDFSKPCGQGAVDEPGQQGGALGLGLAPRGEPGVPLLVGGLAPLLDLPGVGEHRPVDLEALRRVEPEELLGRGDLGVAEGRAVGLAGAADSGCRPGDDRVQAHERGLGARAAALGQRGEQCVDVLGVVGGAAGVGAAAPVDVDDLPAVGLVPHRDVLAERDVGVVLDGDLVRVVDDGEVAELLVARERRGLGGHPLHEVTVGGENPHVVVEDALAGLGLRVEQSALAALGHGHADRRGQPGAERAGGDLDTLGVVHLGVAGGQ
jgi:hypothetical protein